MPYEQLVVTLTLLVVLICLYLGKGAPDQVMLGAMAFLWNLGVISTEQAIQGFSNSSVITIGALFVVAKGLERSKAIDYVAGMLLGKRTTQRMALLRLSVAALLFSGFFNSTPLVAMLVPVVQDWARLRGFAASKFLMPLSFSTIMGGLLTTIGTSTNLVVNGLMAQADLEPFKFFEPALIGLPVGLCGIAYLILVGFTLLPDDRGDLFKTLTEKSDDLMAELELTEDCPFQGVPIFDALEELEIPEDALVKILRKFPDPSLRSCNADGTQSDESGRRASSLQRQESGRHSSLGTQESDLNVKRSQSRRRSFTQKFSYKPNDTPTEVLSIFPVTGSEIATAGDVLVLSMGLDQLVRLTAVEPTMYSKPAFRINHSAPMEITGTDSDFVEIVLGPQSPVVGCSFKDGCEQFRLVYQASLIAVRSRSASGSTESYSAPVARYDDLTSTKTLTDKSLSGTVSHHPSLSETTKFRVGDVVLLLVPDVAPLPPEHFLLVARVAEMPQPITWFDWVPLIVFGISLVAVAMGIIPMVRVALTLSVFSVLGGWVDVKHLRSIIDWHLLTLIGSALGMAEAIQQSGLSSTAASYVIAAGLPPSGALALLFLVVMVTTELVTNNAAAALGLPLAIELASQMGLTSARPFAMAVMVAASTSYACPIGYATNLMVLGPGNYSFGDFLRVGLVMDLLYLVGCSLLIPYVYPIS